MQGMVGIRRMILVIDAVTPVYRISMHDAWILYDMPTNVTAMRRCTYIKAELKCHDEFQAEESEKG